MRKAEVFRLSMAHPADLSELDRLLASGAVRAADVTAIIGKTEGNGGVNDFSRDYFTQTLMALLSKYLNKPAEQLIREIPGGAEHQGPDGGGLIAVIAVQEKGNA